jgi:beta-lactamase superfamily II metal-dependent hydrolase/catechol 2,3-dioxygenase-like lactoylglutathione lyase family enzyme
MKGDKVMRWTVGFTAALAALILAVGAIGGEAEKTLDIYFLDMVGGGSTLIVTPLGESVLIDTGSREPMHRDADRIYQACKDAGLKQIDYLITTHFHLDHFGALLELSKRIPIKSFYDKGVLPPADEQDSDWFRQLYPLYQQATKNSVKPLRAGDDVPLINDPAGKIPPIKLHCVASEKKIEGFDGDIDAAVEGFEIRKPDESDNARSIALVLTYGRFKFFAGGDITWNVEHHLAQPTNRIGKVDLYQVTHHGLDLSNNPVLLKALNPTVCVSMNGPRKGIEPNTFKAIKGLSSVKAIYQIHYNTQFGDAGNTGSEFIANPKESQKEGRYIKASIYPEKGIFTISIGRDGQAKSYPIQGALAAGVKGVRFEHIALNVHDVEAVVNWYCENLGMKVVRKGPPPVNMRFLADGDDNIVFEFYHNIEAPIPDCNMIHPRSYHVAFVVDDVGAICDKLLKAGATIAVDMETTAAGDQIIILRDPWAMPIQFVKRTKPMLVGRR